MAKVVHSASRTSQRSRERGASWKPSASGAGTVPANLDRLIHERIRLVSSARWRLTLADFQRA